MQELCQKFHQNLRSYYLLQNKHKIKESLVNLDTVSVQSDMGKAVSAGADKVGKTPSVAER